MTCYAQNFPNRLFVYEGSGWLIDDSTVVTAGHCVYNIARSGHWSENLGIVRAVDIEVHIGYARGKCSGSSDVESRKGKWVLTHHEWYDKQEKDCDIAMIRLEDAFEHPRTFRYVNETPRKGENEEIHVVGYPADVPLYFQQNMPEGSAGQVMYESSRTMTWDLDKPDTGLTYRADTYRGNSGGPVLRYNEEGKLKVIGAHVSGDRATGINSATTLGHYGNHLPTFLDALNSVQSNAFVNGRRRDVFANGWFRNDKVEGWPPVQILTLPYVRPS
ncbi:trypsin-like cysteine/serine peptidase domain-containing protein [Xylaria castorea]|nr:trypsin-like cysteine/serine peptidase domain-containing protein [Xylaria castorea]